MAQYFKEELTLENLQKRLKEQPETDWDLLFVKPGYNVLHTACIENRVDVVYFLIFDVPKNKRDINVSGAGGDTPLLLASRNGHVAIVKLLEDQVGILMNKTNCRGESPLYVACKQGYFEVVRWLLSYEDTDINISNDWTKKTPLEIACKKRHYEIIKYLLNRRYLELDPPDPPQQSILYKASKQGDLKIVELLMASPKIEWEDTDLLEKSLEIACQKGNVEVVNFFLNDKRLSFPNYFSMDINPLLIASENGDLEMVQLLVTHPSLSPLSECPFDPPFLRAYENGHHHIARYLLDFDIVNISFEFRSACRSGNVGALMMLLNKVERKDEIYINDQDDNGNTALHGAIQANSFEVVQILLKQPGIDVNAVNYRHETPFFFAARFADTRIVKRLLEFPNIAVNVQDEHGATPFFACCLRKDIGLMKLLIKDERIDVNIPSNNHTPLMRNCLTKNSKILKLILASGRADLNFQNAEGQTAITIASRGNHKALKILEHYSQHEEDAIFEFRNEFGILSNFFLLSTFF